MKGVRPKVLVICDYYLPGSKSGGGMRTVVNTVERLSDEFDFLVVTRDHDGKGDRRPYPDIKYSEWNDVGKAKVRYLRPGEIRVPVLSQIIEESKPDLIYLNSFFSTLTRKLLMFNLRSPLGLQVVLAPCGELSPGALKTKRLKKTIYSAIARLSGLLRGISWKASSESEIEEIKRVAGPGARITVAPDLPDATLSSLPPRISSKTVGRARLIFISRISPKKNLAFLIERLRSVDSEWTLDVFGDTDDRAYLEKCRSLAGMDGKIRFKGPLDHGSVISTMREYDFFVLPTRGENFGHVILEALSAGVPPLISDRTPWTDLKEASAGLVSPLAPEAWDGMLRECVKMDGTAHQILCSGARARAERFLNDPEVESRTRELLRKSVSNVEL